MNKRIFFVVILMVLLFSGYTPKVIANDTESLFPPDLFPLEGKTVTLLAFEAAEYEYEYSEALIKISGMEDPIWLEVASLQYRKSTDVQGVTFLTWGDPYFTESQKNLNYTGVWFSDGFHAEIRETFVPTPKDITILQYFDKAKDMVTKNGGEWVAPDSPYSICINLIRNHQYTAWNRNQTIYYNIWNTCFDYKYPRSNVDMTNGTKVGDITLYPPDYEEYTAKIYQQNGPYDEGVIVVWWYDRFSQTGIPVKPGIAFYGYECAATEEDCFPVLFYTATGERIKLNKNDLYIHFTDDKYWDYFWFIYEFIPEEFDISQLQPSG